MSSRRRLYIGMAFWLVACTTGGSHGDSSATVPHSEWVRVESKSNPTLEQSHPSLDTANQRADFPPRWSEQLDLTSLADIDANFSAINVDGFGALARNGNAVTPRSCRERRSLFAQGYAPANTVEEQSDGFAGIRCGTLALLRGVLPAQRSFVRNIVFDDSVTAFLPAVIATALSRESLQAVQKASERGESLRFFDRKLHGRVASPSQILVLAEQPGDESRIVVEPQAWGDFNGDGDDDVVVSVINFPGGTTCLFRLLVLTRTEPSAVLRVVSGT